jgi:hypothetical protein
VAVRCLDYWNRRARAQIDGMRGGAISSFMVLWVVAL